LRKDGVMELRCMPRQCGIICLAGRAGLYYSQAMQLY
jgi:hypothetical protein